MNEKLKEIAQDIRDLRDSDSHVCKSETTDDNKDCTCEEYDRVIDKIESLKEMYN